MAEANKTIEELQAELAAVKAENEALSAEKQNLAADNAKLEKAINTDSKSTKVTGTYKNESGTYAFVDGAIMTRLPDGSAVPTSELMKIASKSTYEPSAEALASYGSLKELTHESAKEVLDRLVEIKYGLITKVK